MYISVFEWKWSIWEYSIPILDFWCFLTTFWKKFEETLSRWSIWITFLQKFSYPHLSFWEMLTNDVVCANLMSYCLSFCCVWSIVEKLRPANCGPQNPQFSPCQRGVLLPEVSVTMRGSTPHSFTSHWRKPCRDRDDHSQPSWMIFNACI
jgi:hypothetical protein